MQESSHIFVLTEANEKLSAHCYEKLLVRSLLFSCRSNFRFICQTTAPSNLCVRYIYNLKSWDHISLYYQKLNGIALPRVIVPIHKSKFFSQSFTVFTGNDLP
ncbi:hypothetical protein PR048_012756, partial [Dryococelus australis]